MPHPFKMKPSVEIVSLAIRTAKKIQQNVPGTTCKHNMCCCNAGCPNMYYSEYLAIRDEYIEKLPIEIRLDITIECVKRYLTPQLVSKPKPCLFIEGNGCSIYDNRPLKCRLYGIIPQSLYKQIVKAVSNDIKVPEKHIPLHCQCGFVKIKDELLEKYPTGKMTEEQISSMEMAMRENDMEMGVPKKYQDANLAFLTFHDWHLLFDLGEKWLEHLTPLRDKLDDAGREKFLEELKKQLAAVLK